MPNAAHELADLFAKWRTVPDSKTLAGLRAESGPIEDVQLRTVALYASVKQSIDALEAQGEDVADLRIWLPDWYKAVFEPDASWSAGASATRPVIDVKVIAALRRLALYLDKSGFTPPTIAEGASSVSEQALSDVIALLNADGVHLDPFSKDYVFELLTQIRAVFTAGEQEVSLNLLRKINELRGALDDIADRVERQNPKSETPSLLRRAAARIMPLVVRGAVVTGFLLDGAADVHELTTGH